MPTRILREGIITSEKINNLSHEAELFYRRLMSVMDDYGRYFSHPSLLRAACYPLQLEKVSESHVQQMLSECTALGLLVIYGDGKYVFCPNFGQQTRSKSKFPEPSGDELLSDCKASDKQMSSLVGVGVGVGVELQTNNCAPTLDEVKARAQLIGMAPDEAERFWNHFESSGWIDKNGHQIVKWGAKLSTWNSDSRARPLEAAHNEGGKTSRPSDLRNVIEAKRALAADIKTQYCSEVAMGECWRVPEKRTEYLVLCREVKQLQRRLSNMA